MGIRKIKFIKDRYYHLYNRGTNRNKIFFETENYLFLLKKLSKYKNEFDIDIIAYCLMPNHYHFLLRQNSENLISYFMQRVFNSYTKAINKKYNRSGTLFEGKYKAIYVDKENYLIHLCRYIHRNPLEAKLVDKLEDWEFSNYIDWIGKRNGKLIDRNFINERFDDITKYKEFVNIEKEYQPPKNFGSIIID